MKVLLHGHFNIFTWGKTLPFTYWAFLKLQMFLTMMLSKMRFWIFRSREYCIEKNNVMCEVFRDKYNCKQLQSLTMDKRKVWVQAVKKVATPVPRKPFKGIPKQHTFIRYLIRYRWKWFYNWFLWLQVSIDESELSIFKLILMLFKE